MSQTCSCVSEQKENQLISQKSASGKRLAKILATIRGKKNEQQ